LSHRLSDDLGGPEASARGVLDRQCPGPTRTQSTRHSVDFLVRAPWSNYLSHSYPRRGAVGFLLTPSRTEASTACSRFPESNSKANGSAEAVPSLGRGPLGNGRFEGLLRAVPVAGHERFFASGHQISDHLTSHGKIMSLGAGFSTHPLSAFNFVSEVSNLYRIHPDGSGLEQLTRHDTGHFRATQPRYTPDGEWILLTTVTPSSRSLWAHPRRGR